MMLSYVAKVEKRKPSTLTLVTRDESLSDCWPGWSTAVCDPDEVERSAERNSPGKVLFEAGLVLALGAFLVILVTLFVPPP